MTLRHYLALITRPNGSPGSKAGSQAGSQAGSHPAGPAGGGACRVAFPDLPGCTSAGRDLQHAAEQASEALSLHVDGLVEDGQPLPEPSAPDAPLPPWLEGAIPADALRLLVGVDVPSRALRINLTMEETLLGRLDAAAAAEGCSRAAYVARAVRDRLRAEARSVPSARPLGAADVMVTDIE